MNRREKIAALRRLAASTPFGPERDSALAKAAQLEALGPDGESDDDRAGFDRVMDAFDAMDRAESQWKRGAESMRGSLDAYLVEVTLRRVAEQLGATRWRDNLWAVPGVGPLMTNSEMLRYYAEVE